MIRRLTRLALVLLAALALYLGYDQAADEWLRDAGTPPTTQSEPAPPALPDAADPPPGKVSAGDAAILTAFAEQRSGVRVTSAGTVVRLLADDEEGSRHQRFIVRLLSADHTLLISHNIDLAPRVPLQVGDRVEFSGQFEWNEQGGVLHWTHHDPDGQHAGGWIRFAGKRYE